MQMLLLRLWPALIPIVFYLLWLAFRRRRALRLGEAPPGLWDGPWGSTIIASLLVAIISLLVLGLGKESKQGRDYQPTRLENGKLIRGGFDR